MHTAFPMYNIEDSLKNAKKVKYPVDQPLLVLLHEHLIEINEFFCYLFIS